MVGDSTGTALTNATVLLISSQDSLSVITKEDGHFQFKLSETKAFEIQVTMKGYLPYKKKYTPGEKVSSFQLKPIVLQTDYHELDPVIVAQVRPITFGEDTITYHAGAFKVRDGSEVEALLKRLPGVEVDMDGNVIVQGKKVTRAMVDGKLFFGGDVLTAIRNLPADIVDKLQIIDDYGDKTRLIGIKSGESTKMLNIVLKKDRKSGEFGQLQAGMGTEGKFIADIFANSFSGERQISINGGWSDNSAVGKGHQSRINFSYGDRLNNRWKIETNVGYTVDDPHSNSNVIQDNYYAGGITHLEQVSQISSENRDGNISNILTYTPDANLTLRISPNINVHRSLEYNYSTFNNLQRDTVFTKTSHGIMQNLVDRKADIVGSQFYFEKSSSHSKRKFSAAIETQYGINRQNADDLLNNSVELNTGFSNTQQHYLLQSENPIWNLNANMTYFSPVGKSAYLEFGYNWSQSSSHNIKHTYSQDSLSLVPILIDSLNQDYLFRTTLQKIHLGYSARIHMFSLSAGIDAQRGNMIGNTSSNNKFIEYPYFIWLPSLQASYPYSKTGSLSLQYNGNPSLPGLQQLQPIADLSNPQYPIVGNPSLRPSYTHAIILHYEHSSLQPTQFVGFGINIGYSATPNSIVSNNIYPKDSTSVIQRTEFENIKGVHSYYIDCHFTLPTFLHKMIRVTLNGNMTTINGIVITDNILYPTVTNSATQSIHIQCIIQNIFESDFSGNYTFTNSRYPVGIAPSTLAASAGIGLNNHHYFFRKWILSYQYSKLFTSTLSNGLQGYPSMLTASIQRQFLLKNKATLSLTGYNLLDHSSSGTQSATTTSVTKIQSSLIGRYILASFILKLNKFK